MTLQQKKAALGKLFAARDKIRTGHADRCMADMDPDYYGPCSPGCPSAANYAARDALDAAIDALLS